MREEIFIQWKLGANFYDLFFFIFITSYSTRANYDMKKTNETCKIILFAVQL